MNKTVKKSSLLRIKKYKSSPALLSGKEGAVFYIFVPFLILKLKKLLPFMKGRRERDIFISFISQPTHSYFNFKPFTHLFKRDTHSDFCLTITGTNAFNKKKESTISTFFQLKKLAASTLVEVITALTIISMTSAIFMAVLFKAGNYLANRQQQYAMEQIVELINDCKKGDLKTEQEYTYDGFIITKQVSVYHQIKGLWLVHFTALTGDKKLLIDHSAIINFEGQPKTTDEE